jgi:mediator of RNA polymerase II transcription subunit 7
MADQEQSTSSTFPNPPPFWQDFTPENLNRIEQLRKSFAEANPTRDVPTRLPEIPESLINLQPPAEPKDGQWRIFGDHYTVRTPPLPPKIPCSECLPLY